MAITMKPLPALDSHHLSAAQAWRELHAFAEVDAELDNVTASLRAHPKVLPRDSPIETQVEIRCRVDKG